MKRREVVEILKNAGPDVVVDMVLDLESALAIARSERDEYKRLMFEADERAERRLKQVETAEATAERLREERDTLVARLDAINRLAPIDAQDADALRRARALAASTGKEPTP